MPVLQKLEIDGCGHLPADCRNNQNKKVRQMQELLADSGKSRPEGQSAGKSGREDSDEYF